MPDWTLGTIGSQATKRIGFRDDISLSDVSFWVNQAQVDFVRDVPDLLSEKTHWFSLSSGDSVVALPTSWVETIVISHQTTSSTKTIRQIAPEVADSLGYYPVGEPAGYFIYNKDIQFWPSANSSENTTAASSGRSYLHRYKSYPADMVELTDEPEVAYEHRKAILYKTEVFLHELLGNLEEAAISEVRYANFVSSLKDSIARRQVAKTRFAVSLPDWKKKTAGVGTNRSDSVWLRT